MKNSGTGRLVFATNNRHKIKELQELIGQRIQLLSPADLGFTEEIPEEANTLEGNAAQKAFFVYAALGINCFADDTGLEIEALNGAPGVFSARYAGKNCSFDDNMNKVLASMKGETNRKACFRTVIALVENGKLTDFQGKICGQILDGKRGLRGFGYDPIFLPDGFDRTFAEMDLSEKNRISHRALAVQKLIDYLEMQYF